MDRNSTQRVNVIAATAGGPASGGGAAGRGATGWCVPGTECPVTQVTRRVARKVQADALPVLAGHLAFRLMFALFPTLIALLWLLNVVNAGELATEVSEVVGMVVPGVANDPLKEQVDSAPSAQARGEFTMGVGLSLVIAIWALGEVFRATMHALNVIYGVEERRSRLRRLITSLAVSVLTLTLFVGALVLIVAGARFSETLADWSGVGIGYELAWSGAAWVTVILAVTAAFALTYYFAPDVEQRLRWVRAGSLFAVAAWLLFTGSFAIYVNVLSQPSETYGSLAGVAFFMVYVYGASFILLLGAVTNQVIEEWEPEGKDPGERQPND